MRKILFATVFMLMILSGSALAFKFDVSPSFQRAKMEELVDFTLVLENNQNYADEVRITVEGSHLAWIQDSYPRVKIQPGDRKLLNLTIYPTGGMRGKFTYNVTAESIRYHGLAVTRNFTLYVRYPLNIVTFQAEKIDDQLEMIMDLEAIGQQSSTILVQVRNSREMVVSDFSLDVEVNGSKRIIKYINASGFLAGDYMVVANIAGTELYKEAPFTVEPVSNVVQEKKVVSNPLFRTVEVTIENRGNVVEKDYEYYQDVPSDAFTGFVTRPDNCFDQEGGMKCKYVISELRPGMTAKIIYRIDMWPILGGYALGLMGLVSGAGFAFKKTTRPKLRKKSIKKSASEHTIYLELKNKFMKDIDNIVVRDWVSPLAVVVNQFDSVKPVIRKSDAGTELIWKLDKIEKKDDRILSYKIRTMINGEIKMPRAYIRYKNKKGDKGKVFSNPLVIR